MSEASRKNNFIKEFLIQLKDNVILIEDTWIERELKPPGESGEVYEQVTTAHSLSENPISSTKEMIEDDLRHSFEDGYFAFRFISASPGSGKTTLLRFLYEYLKTKASYWNRSIVVSFELSNLLPPDGGQSFLAKFYSYVLASTFWQMLKNREVKHIAERILKERFSADVFNTLYSAIINDLDFDFDFADKFNEYSLERNNANEKFFLYVVEEVTKTKQDYTFVYLIDDLDALRNYDDSHTQQAIFLIRSLVDKISKRQFKSEVHQCLIYQHRIPQKVFYNQATFEVCG